MIFFAGDDKRQEKPTQKKEQKDIQFCTGPEQREKNAPEKINKRKKNERKAGPKPADQKDVRPVFVVERNTGNVHSHRAVRKGADAVLVVISGKARRCEKAEITPENSPQKQTGEKILGGERLSAAQEQTAEPCCKSAKVKDDPPLLGVRGIGIRIGGLY